ncbi:Type-1V conjugative transfer system mating pair stabilisation [Desulfacinum hydrothermale DSM 13146]|uniref:Type-1V conjugative transfer system mating pair stabilisation n=1 Tax=Desulfacinum hydrothermale DSM 13146 TaxID=1121390 RepID=A0A1W1XYH5_9BACT|nr:Type-1V conjugative transfer system mating pair stabilisation [Desulfacinum hydrothermale DSM 13146]
MRRIVSVAVIFCMVTGQVVLPVTKVRADEVVESAMQGQNFGLNLLHNSANLPDVKLGIDPGGRVSSSNTIYVQEFAPGAEADDMNSMAYGYDDPESLAVEALQARSNLMKDGCPVIHFAPVSERVVLTATIWEQYYENGNEILTPSTYTGRIEFSVPTIGADRTWHTTLRPRSGNGSALILKFQNTPFPAPRDSSFTINHNVKGEHGESGNITSYGTIDDGFSSTGSIYLSGSHSFTVSAHLYRVNKYYVNENCPTYPPAECIYDGVDLCDIKAMGVRAFFDTENNTSQQQAFDVVYSSFYDNPEPDLTDDYSLVSMLARTNAIYDGTDPITQIFGGCTWQESSASRSTKTVHVPDYYSCSGVYLGQDGCTSFQRRFEFEKVASRVVAAITQYEYEYGQGNPPPITGEHQVSVAEPINFSCPTVGSAETKRIELDNGYIIVECTPFSSGDFVYNHHFTSGSGTVADYGTSGDGWTMKGTVIPDGSTLVEITADLYAITTNTIDGCTDFMAHARDGWCSYSINCTDERTCVTIDGVNFCQNAGPAHGIFDLLEVLPDINGQPVVPATCWAGNAPPMECEYAIGNSGECYTDPQGEIHCIENDGTGLDSHPDIFPGGVDDCEYHGYYNDPACTYIRTECEEGAVGQFSGACYVGNIIYDCGEDIEYEEQEASANAGSELCSSTIRCMGTECHNPASESNGDLDRAIAATGLIQMMQSDLACAETGNPPTSVDEPCTPVVFSGKTRKCKTPIGHEIGLTPDCCREGAKAAAGVDALSYVKLVVYGAKIANNPLALSALADIPGYSAFAEALEPVGHLTESGFKLLNNTLVSPLANGITHLGYEVTGTASETVAREAAKNIGINSVKQQVMSSFYHYIKDTLGMPELADSLFTTSGGQIALNSTISTIINAINMAFLAYNVLKIIGHLVFKCDEDELRLGIDRKVGNCVYIGTYCAKKVFLIGCIVKKTAYCCYKSPLARIIMQQIRPQLGGFGSPKDPNCAGLTPQQLEQVDWSRVDLSEWVARLQQSGLVPSSMERARQIWSASYPRSKRAYGIDPPGPDGQVSGEYLLHERYADHTDRMADIKDTMAKRSVCYTDMEYMPWYEAVPDPENQVCFDPQR